MLTNNQPFCEYFNNGVNPESIYESRAQKDGREYCFVSFTKDGQSMQALVSEAALAAYDAENYDELEVSNIIDENGVELDLLSINKRGTNKVKKTFAFMAVNK